MASAITFVCAAAALSVPSFAQADASAPKNLKNIVEVASEAGQFKTLIAAAKAAGLAEALTGKGPLTVFAPTDAAFAELGDMAIADLLKPENKDKLAAILKFHVVSGAVPSTAAVKLKEAKTIGGKNLELSFDGKVLTVIGAKVVKADIAASNGVIHVIDSVMMPKPNIVEAASAAGKFATLLAAATAAGLAPTLADGGPFTVFAPTDEAFAKLGKDTIADLLKPENKANLVNILKYHVVSGTVPSSAAVKLKSAKAINGQELNLSFDGKVLSINDSKVIMADVEACNGVIHVIDTVLLPRS